MKKVILTLSVIGLMTACSSTPTEVEAPKIDSTAVVVDTTAVLTESVCVDTTLSVPTTTK